MKRKAAPKARKTRAYDNSARTELSAKTRQAIILALVDLLVETKGADVEIAKVATRCGISQRTIFRFFKDKTSLLESTAEYIGGYLLAANQQLTVMKLGDFVHSLFRAFDKSSQLTLAYLFSSFGQEARTLMRGSLNQTLIARLLADSGLELTAQNKDRVGFIVSLVNARVWYEMKTDFGLEGEKSAEVVAWAIETLTKSLREG